MKAANVGQPAREWNPDEALPRVARALDQAPRVLCVMHAGPDGDAAGSTLGLALALAERGHDATLMCSSGLPWNLRFLPGSERIVPAVDERAVFDATVVCDVGASHRIGPGLPEAARRGVWINIDHHLTSDGFGDINWVDPDAAAVGVMIHRLLRHWGQRPSREVATALYTSVLTDTGSFRYSSTNPEALHVAADLVAAGADPWLVSSSIYENQPIERLQLLRDVLGTLDVSADGRFASILVTRGMRAGREDLTDGFINYARSVQGVEVAAQFSEPLDGTPDAWHVSFRSRGRVNVAAVAGRFGGGGHHNAAGALVRGALADVRERVAAAVAAELAAAG